MDHLPSVTIAIRYGEYNEKLWKWTITRRKVVQDGVDMTFDDRTYTYDMANLDGACHLIATDHVSRHWKNHQCTITSNLGFSPYDCKCRDLHKHLRHTLKLFKTVQSITAPADINLSYVP